MENSLLYNGRFLHSLDGWQTNAAVYNAGDGDAHYGVAIIPVGGYIEQSFGALGVRNNTIHISVKSPSGALTSGQAMLIIEDGDGNQVVSASLAGGTDWTENIILAGLAQGTTYSIRIDNISAPGSIRVDDIWIWTLPITRDAIAARVHDMLGRLATERGYSKSPNGDLTEGSYTYAIDGALRNVGAIDEESGLVDIRMLGDDAVQSVISTAYREMLRKLRAEYAAEVDTSVGQYRQSLSQKVAAIAEMLDGDNQSGGASPQPVIQRKIFYD